MRNEKTFVLCLIAISVGFGCSSFGKIKAKHDSFKNATLVSLKMRHSSEESFGFGRTYAEVTYLKEVKQGQVEKFDLNFNLYGLGIDKGASIGNEGFFKVGDKQIKFSTESVRMHSETSVDSSASTSNVTGKTSVETSSSTSYNLIGKVSVAPEIIEELKSASSFLIRVYVGSEPKTFVVAESDFAKVKEFALIEKATE